MSRQLSEFIIKYRWLVVIVSIAIAMALGKGGENLSFTNNYRVFFGADNPELLAFEELQDTYNRTDNILIAFAPKNGNVFTPETLEAIQFATEEAWQVPYSLRVDSISNFQNTYAEQDDLIVEDLYEDVSALSASDIERIKAISTAEPQLVHRVISPSGHVAGVNITVELPGIDEGTEGPEVTAAARALVAEINQRYPDIDTYMSGMIMMNNAFLEATIKDFGTLIPLAFLVIVIGLIISFRTFAPLFITLLVVALSIMSAMGLAGWLGFKLTPPSSGAPTMILTLAVADCVHILISYIHSLRKGMAKYDAIHESLRLNLQPVFLTSVTTAIGFLSLNFSDSPPFNDLGNITSFGMLFALFYSVFLLPALIAILPIKVKPYAPGHIGLMDRFAEWLIKYRSKVLIVMSVVAIGFSAMITRNELNDVFVEYFDKSVQFRTDSDFISENLSGIYFIDYSIEGEGANSISNPKFLQDIEKFSAWLRQQPEVIHVNTISDTIKRLNKNMNYNQDEKYIIPESRELSAQYLLLYEMSLPYGLDLNNQINLNKSATRVSVTLKTISSNEVLMHANRYKKWMEENTPDIVTIGSSPTTMFANIGKRNIVSMLKGTTLALILISFILMFTLRSFKYGIISLIPNLLPAAIAFGIWGLVIGQVGLALSVVAGMTLGIVVDDTIHFLSKYMRGRREKNLSAEDAVRYAFNHVGTALVVTTLVLCGGFLILSLSSFELNSGMGLLTAITITIALIVDFLLLPTLLMKIEGDKDASLQKVNQ